MIVFTTDNSRHFTVSENGQTYPRFRPASPWLKSAMVPAGGGSRIPVNLLSLIVENNKNYLDDIFIMYEIHTEQNPGWWSGFNSLVDDIGPNMFEIVPDWVLECVRKKTAILYYDQMLEGFPLNGYLGNFYEPIHKALKEYNIPPSQIVYTTCNLIEKEKYDSWCYGQNITDKINIVPLNMFATMCAGSSFFGLTEAEIRAHEHIIYKQTHEIKLFNNLNRVIREHRVAMTSMLNYHKLIDNNLVSQDMFPFHQREEFKSLNYSQHPAWDYDNMVDITSKLPLVLDTDQFQHNKAQNFFKEVYLDSWVSLITETFFNESIDDTVFFSEKIYKPIRARHPFILVGQYNGLKKFRKIGFKTFSEFWDESYDDIRDNTQRMEAICLLLKDLSKLSKNEWISLYMRMIPTLEHNMKMLTQTNWTYDTACFLNSLVPEQYFDNELINYDLLTNTKTDNKLDFNRYFIWDHKINSEYHINRLATDLPKKAVVFAPEEFELIHGMIDNTELADLDITVIFGSSNSDYIANSRSVPINSKIVNWGTYWFNATYNHFIDKLDMVQLGNIDKLFISLNNKAHNHRCMMMDELCRLGLLEHGYLSWHEPDAKYDWKYWTPEHLVLDSKYVELLDSYQTMPEQYGNTLINLIAESTMITNFITEKTCTAILFNKPFIVFAPKGFHQELTKLGFVLYDELFDYTFDNVDDIEQRLQLIMENLERL
jgi:hypothetical protein